MLFYLFIFYLTTICTIFGEVLGVGLAVLSLCSTLLFLYTWNTPLVVYNLIHNP